LHGDVICYIVGTIYLNTLTEKLATMQYTYQHPNLGSRISEVLQDNTKIMITYVDVSRMDLKSSIYDGRH